MALLALQKGRLCVLGQSQMCHLWWWQKFIFLCGGGVLFFLGSACMSPSWSAGQGRVTAKLSAELRSSEKSGQDVKGRWFSCYVDGCSVVF